MLTPIPDRWWCPPGGRAQQPQQPIRCESGAARTVGLGEDRNVSGQRGPGAAWAPDTVFFSLP